MQEKLVKISFRVGHSNIKIDDIKRLHEGRLLTLENFCDNDIEVVVGNTTLAKGAIVEMDSDYYVKVTELYD